MVKIRVNYVRGLLISIGWMDLRGNLGVGCVVEYLGGDGLNIVS